MQGGKKPPTSEVVEASKTDWRSERNTRPPAAMPIRRDDRAEPDDEEVGSSRIDVVNVDGGPRDSATTGMVSLRRELAKLHQQAAAVEKSLEDQRRDRSDSLDRLERATERVTQLEEHLERLEGEAKSLRTERDDLAAAIEVSKASLSELGKVRLEVDRLRAAAVEASQTTRAELAKAKEETASAVAEAKQARVEAQKAREALHTAEGDAAMVGDQASKIREEAAKIRFEAEKGREETKQARDEAAKAQEEAAKAREEATKAREEATKAREVASNAQAAVAKAAEELTKGRAELTKSSEELTKSREDHARAKEDNTRDRATARDRIDLLDRALEDARATSLRTESELEKARASEERIGRQLEAAHAATAQAESRVATISTAHAALEQNLRRLRDEVAGAFSRIGHAQPPPLPEKQVIVSIAPDAIESAPPSMPDVPELEPHESIVPSSPASKSVPPPPSASVAPVAQVLAPKGSIPPPTYASVPPQIHESAAPGMAPPLALVLDDLPPGALRRTTPPPVANSESPPSRKGTMPPPATHGSIPAEARGSTAPASGAHDSLPPADRWGDSSPPTRRPGGSVPPPANEVFYSSTRETLLAKLVDPDNVDEAVMELKQHPEWLRSVPPPTFVAALASVDYNADASIFELARVWDREPLCHALIAALRSESDPRLREHSAWLLKHLAAPSSWKAIADLAQSDEEPAQLRRWLLEALDRLAAGRAIGWRELGDVVTTVAHHPDASLRDGVVGVLVSLDRSDDKRRLLMDILRTDDDEVVLASAVNALASVLPMELDPLVGERLLGHPSARVQRSVRDLIERMKQTKA